MTQASHARLPAAKRRAAIVTAALQVFGSGSYAGSTTAEIARAAGVSEPIIYRHFPSKRELWFACLDEAWRELRTAIELRAASVARTGALATVHTEKSSPWANPLLPTLWLQGVTEASEDEEIQRHVRAHVHEVHDFVAEMMRGYQTGGTMAADRDPNGNGNQEQANHRDQGPFNSATEGQGDREWPRCQEDSRQEPPQLGYLRQELS